MKYGSEEYPVDFPAGTTEIVHREPEPEVDLDRFRRDLGSYLYSINRPVKNVGIAVSDKTRLCQFPVFLPLIVEAFTEYGIKKENITFYIAYGTHPRQSEEECLQAYGDIYRQFRFVHHDSRDGASLTSLGTTTRGTEVKINSAILQHDLLVTFGAILHHYFAGFGGGRKLLFPGLAGYESILYNHSLFLDFENNRLQPGCRSGELNDNPLAEDLQEINALLPEKLEIHGILNSHKEVCQIHFGLRYGHFRDACDRYDEHFRIADDKTYDVVVASAGGYPKDINYIQSHKSIHNAASFVKDGGTLVVYAECRDGIGNQKFMDLFSLGGQEGIYRAMEQQYMNNAGTALATLEKAARIRILFVTSLDRADVERMGMEKASPEEAARLVAAAKGDVARISNASLVYR